uniref:Cytosolic fatty-acid binding proteins domain-containing protein n=1 Tax=Panagrolaimus superbus TaxID=310955 RepID=A0A914Z752_9BILA
MPTFRIATFFLVILIYCIFSNFEVMASGDTGSLPDKFLGSFKLEKSENFDEFLASKGVNWFVRKMIQMASITKIFQKSADKPNRYTAINLSSKENTKWEDWALNEPFEAKGLDGTRHKITFGLPDENTLTENHVRIEYEGDNDETYHYTREGDYLILKMSNEKITCRRFFKVQPENKK